MNLQAEIIEITQELDSERVRYYTIRQEGEPHNLFELFLIEHKGKEHIKEELNDLLGWISVRMGQQKGAKEGFFRHERNAHALPPHKLSFKYKHNLRLYCLRISDNIVFLFNGGIKTPRSRTAQECPVVSHHFNMAVRLTEKIDQAIREHQIYHDTENSILRWDENFRLEL